MRRDTSAKKDIPRHKLVEDVRTILDDIQQSMYQTAKQKRDACIVIGRTWEEFTDALAAKKMVLAPWCDEMVISCAFLSLVGKGYGFLSSCLIYSWLFERISLLEFMFCRCYLLIHR